MPVKFFDFNSRPSARGDARGSASRLRRTNFNSRPSARGDRADAYHRAGEAYFNSRPSARGDPHGFCNPQIRNFISIHAPPRGATSNSERRKTMSIFQFTPLREGRRLLATSKPFTSYFNSRPSARGDGQREAGCTADGSTFQFTPLREGRRACRFLVFCGFPFQFTPLREGRRPAPCKGRLRGSYFNSRPSARGDGFCHGRLRPHLHFNSRPSARGDWRLRNPCRWRILISIHAPPRGATQAQAADCCCKTQFQFTPLREGRHPAARRTRRSMYFNSRPSARGDERFSTFAPLSAYFNSRPSARGDFGLWCSDNIVGFQFTPLREGRPGLQPNRDWEAYFNSRPSARGDACPNREARWREIFQFTPLREGRHARREGEGTAGYFNSRPSARGDERGHPPAE